MELSFAQGDCDSLTVLSLPRRDLPECPGGVLTDQGLLIIQCLDKRRDCLRMPPVPERNGYVAGQTAAFGALDRGATELPIELLIIQREQAQKKWGHPTCPWPERRL